MARETSDHGRSNQFLGETNSAARPRPDQTSHPITLKIAMGCTDQKKAEAGRAATYISACYPLGAEARSCGTGMTAIPQLDRRGSGTLLVGQALAFDPQQS